MGCARRFSKTFIAIAIAGFASYSVMRMMQPRLSIVDEHQVCVEGQILSMAAADGMLVAGVSRPHRVPGQSSALQVRHSLYVQGPLVIGELGMDADVTRLVTDGRNAYAIAYGLHVVSLEDPTHPETIATLDWEIPRERSDGSRILNKLSAMHRVGGMVINNDLLLVQVVSHGVSLIDTSDPSSPRLASVVTFPPGDTASGVAAAGSYIYAMERGLRVIDAHDPREPREIARIDVPDEARVSSALAVDDQANLLYVAANGLFVFDIEDPTAPQLIWRAGKANMWTAGMEHVFESDRYQDLVLGEDTAIVLTMADILRPARRLVFDRRSPRVPHRVGKRLKNGSQGFEPRRHEGYYATSPGRSRDDTCRTVLVSGEMTIRAGWGD
jgi:hypothetical protein